jgi:O-antigen ligase
MLFLALGGFSFYLDFRYHAGICMAIAFLLYLRIWQNTGGVARKLPVGRMILVAILAVGALFAGYKLSEDAGTAGRRAASNEGRLFGLLVGSRALFESPLLGYGSWGRSEEIAAVEVAVKAEMGPEAAGRVITGLAAIVHSELFQSWLEGGALGAAFFVVFLIGLVRTFPKLCLHRGMDALLPILLYWYLFASWEVVNAPFGANSRMHIALGAATLVITAMEARMKRAVSK